MQRSRWGSFTDERARYCAAYNCLNLGIFNEARPEPCPLERLEVYVYGWILLPYPGISVGGLARDNHTAKSRPSQEFSARHMFDEPPSGRPVP